MGVRIEEFDIEKDDVAADRYRKLGGRGVPFIDIEGIIVPGYGEDEIRAAIEQRSKALRP